MAPRSTTIRLSEHRLTKHRLTKNHGLGNDFLVALGTRDALAPLGPSHARRWCDRHTGIGADGLLLGALDVDGADVAMTLFNADGSRAEMSGNGIRCLAQGVADRRGVTATDLVVLTDDGPRAVSVTPTDVPATVSATVDMGPARPGPEADRPTAEGTAPSPTLATDATKQLTIDLGNPHLILLVADLAAVDIAAAGRHHQAAFSAGMNVHAVETSPGEDDAITLLSSERGAGVTLACGTGATAAARAAHDWGLVGDLVTVHMLGGDVEVRVGERMTLIGPATHVADVEVIE